MTSAQEMQKTPVIVEVATMPASVDEFEMLRNEIAQEPYGGAVIFVIALKLYQENPDLGLQCLTIAVDRSRLVSGDV